MYEDLEEIEVQFRLESAKLIAYINKRDQLEGHYKYTLGKNRETIRNAVIELDKVYLETIETLQNLEERRRHAQ